MAGVLSCTAYAKLLLLILVTCTPVLSAPYLKTAAVESPRQKHSLDQIFKPSHGLIGPLFRHNDHSLEPSKEGCYYQFRHYDEGDRIVTNEPCLNCTCHNSMLMCYLKVCPFSKPIGQDCTVEKSPNQCCPVITCPQVPVNLQVMHMTPPPTTSSPLAASSDLVVYTEHGCTINEKYYADGAQVPGNPSKPCELCYCIRNHTACIMQECILKVEGCEPVFEEGICCPVRYICAHEELADKESFPEITTLNPNGTTPLTTPKPSPVVAGCVHENYFYADGASIPSSNPCEHCYCMKTDIVCAIQECRSPLDEDDEKCIPRPPLPGQCCPEAYDCPEVTDIFVPDVEDVSTIAPIVSDDEKDEATASSEIPIETTSGLPQAEILAPEAKDTTPKPFTDETSSEISTESMVVDPEVTTIMVQDLEQEDNVTVSVTPEMKDPATEVTDEPQISVDITKKPELVDSVATTPETLTSTIKKVDETLIDDKPEMKTTTSVAEELEEVTSLPELPEVTTHKVQPEVDASITSKPEITTELVDTSAETEITKIKTTALPTIPSSVSTEEPFKTTDISSHLEEKEEISTEFPSIVTTEKDFDEKLSTEKPLEIDEDIAMTTESVPSVTTYIPEYVDDISEVSIDKTTAKYEEEKVTTTLPKITTKISTESLEITTKKESTTPEGIEVQTTSSDDLVITSTDRVDTTIAADVKVSTMTTDRPTAITSEDSDTTVEPTTTKSAEELVTEDLSEVATSSELPSILEEKEPEKDITTPSPVDLIDTETESLISTTEEEYDVDSHLTTAVQSAADWEKATVAPEDEIIEITTSVPTKKPITSSIQTKISVISTTEAEEKLTTVPTVSTEQADFDITAEETTKKHDDILDQTTTTEKSDVEISKVSTEEIFKETTTESQFVTTQSEPQSSTKEHMDEITTVEAQTEDEISSPTTKLPQISEDETSVSTTEHEIKTTTKVPSTETPIDTTVSDKIVESTETSTEIPAHVESVTSKMTTEEIKDKEETVTLGPLHILTTLLPEFLTTMLISQENKTEKVVADDLPVVTTTKTPLIPFGSCVSNGTIYSNNEIIPTFNKCQSKCECKNGIVTCQFVACPPPPPAFLRCDLKPSNDDCCPVYDCPVVEPDVVPSPECIRDGVQYLEGQFVPSNDSCTDCYCLYGGIVCAYQECPAYDENCKAIEFLPGSCCPSKYECPELEVDSMISTTTGLFVEDKEEETSSKTTVTTTSDDQDVQIVTTQTSAESMPDVPMEDETERPSIIATSTTEKEKPSTSIPEVATKEPEVTDATDKPITVEVITDVESSTPTTEVIDDDLPVTTIQPELVEPEITTKIVEADVTDEEVSSAATSEQPIPQKEPQSTTSTAVDDEIEVFEEKSTIKPTDEPEIEQEFVTELPSSTTASVKEMTTTGSKPTSLPELEVLADNFTSTTSSDIIKDRTTEKVTMVEQPTTTASSYEEELDLTTPSDLSVETELPIEDKDTESPIFITYEPVTETTTELPVKDELIPIKPPAELADKQCSYNGVLYDSGSVVPANLPCYEECHCTNGIVLCSILSCPSPPPEFLNCTADQSARDCCPTYDCPIVTEVEESSLNCIRDGVQYSEGDFISSSDHCLDCYCIRGEIECASQECPEAEPGCVALETPADKCCPTKFECVQSKVKPIELTTLDSLTTTAGLQTLSTEAPLEDKTVESFSKEPIAPVVTEKIITSTVSDTTTEKLLEVDTTTRLPVHESTKLSSTVSTLEAVTEKIESITEKDEEKITTELTIPENVTLDDKEIATVTSQSTTDAIPVVTTKAPVKSTTYETTVSADEFDDITTVISLEGDTIVIDDESITQEPDAELLTTTPQSELELDVSKTTTAIPSKRPVTVVDILTPTTVLDSDITLSDVTSDKVEAETTSAEPEDDKEITTTVSEVQPETEQTTKMHQEDKETTLAPFGLPEITTIDKIITTDSLTTTHRAVTDDLPSIFTDQQTDSSTEASSTTHRVEIKTQPPTTEFPAEEIYDISTTKSEIETTQAPQDVTEFIDTEITTDDAEDKKEITTTKFVDDELPTTKTTMSVAEVLLASTTSHADADSTTKTPIHTEEKLTTSKTDDMQTTLAPEEPEETTYETAEIETEKLEIAALTTSETPTTIHDLDTKDPISTTISFEAEEKEITTTFSTTDRSTTLTTKSSTIKPELKPVVPQKEKLNSCFWFDAKVYEHGSEVAPNHLCQESCKCNNGTVTCEYEACQIVPPSFLRCEAFFRSDSCCPIYECEPEQKEESCSHEGNMYENNQKVPSDSRCIDCYCVNGSIVCATQQCGAPKGDCVPIEQSQDKCCPMRYECNEPLPSVEEDEGFANISAPGGISTPSTIEAKETSTTATLVTKTPISTTHTTTEKLTTVKVPVTTEEIEKIMTEIPELKPVLTEGPITSIEEEETVPEAPAKPVTDSPIITTSQNIVPASENYTHYPPYTPSIHTTIKPAPTPGIILGPGSCLFDGRVYVSAEQIPRDDPCDFCFCFRGDIICLQQTCPPPIPGCYEEAIPGFCCPRYECPVQQSIVSVNITTPSPYPKFPPRRTASRVAMCEIDGKYYASGEKVESASSPCHDCRCGNDGFMKCNPAECGSQRKIFKYSHR